MKKESKKKQVIQPLADRVLVKRTEAPDEKSPAGIIIPETASKEKSKMGTVIATGPGARGDDNELLPVAVKAGDTVIFNSGWDNEVDLGDDEEYFLVKESDVLAIVK